MVMWNSGSDSARVPPEPSGNPKRVIGLLVGLSAIAALAVVIVLLVARPWENDAGPLETTTADAGPRSTGSITGDFDQWRDAVCRTNTFVDGVGMTGAEGSAACIARNGQNILMGEFASDLDVRNAMAGTWRYFASATLSDGTAIAFVDAADGSALVPLTQFGFSIRSAPLVR